jgi:hypothetical protein
MLVFGFDGQTSQFGAVYVVGFLLIFVAIGFLQKAVPQDILFIVVSLLMPASAVLSFNFNIEEKAADPLPVIFPARLVVVLCLVVATGYFIQIGYGILLESKLNNPVAAVIIGVVFCLAVLLLIRRKGLFTIIYSALFLTGLTYLMIVLSKAESIATVITFALSVLLFNLFTCTFVPYVSIKYGKNLWYSDV